MAIPNTARACSTRVPALSSVRFWLYAICISRLRVDHGSPPTIAGTRGDRTGPNDCWRRGIDRRAEQAVLRNPGRQYRLSLAEEMPPQVPSELPGQKQQRARLAKPMALDPALTQPCP